MGSWNMLKDKLTYVKNFKSLFEQKSDSGSTKLEVAGSTPRVEAQERTHMEKMWKQRKEIWLAMA